MPEDFPTDEIIPRNPVLNPTEFHEVISGNRFAARSYDNLSEKRPDNQDRCGVYEGLELKAKEFGFAGDLLFVADGFQGSRVAEWIDQNLKSQLTTYISKSEHENLAEALREFGAYLQEQITQEIDNPSRSEGSTLSLAFIDRDHQTLTLAHLGDSPIFKVTADSRVEQLTDPHVAKSGGLE